ncbi:MAG: nucleotidyltransferase family protein [Pirellulaceae bacterium]|nr:nucleotidyltransferase family protein [Pirellulaceae bacterium]
MSTAPTPSPQPLGLSAADELLLRGALARGIASQAALADWKRARGFRYYDEIDFPATLLLPRIHAHLLRAKLADPWSPQLAKLTRYHWLHNTETLRHFVPLLDKLQQAGCRPLLVGGAALLAGAWLDDLQDRPRLDPQLLIPPAEAGVARRVFDALGWHAARLAPVAGWRNEFWRGSDGGSVLVRYDWLPRKFPFVGHAEVAAGGTTGELSGRAVLVPSATDLMEQCCVLASQRRPAAGYRLVQLVDAWRVLSRTPNGIDWDRLLEQAREHGSLQSVRESLHYFARNFSAPIPADWLRKIDQLAAPRRSLLAGHGPWRTYFRAEQAANRQPRGMRALRYAFWRVTRR